MSFLVVTPLGRQHAAPLLAALADAGITIAAREEIGPWSAAATWLYARPQRPGSIDLALRFEARWRALFPCDLAERWLLADPAAHARLVEAKPALRRRFVGAPLDDAPRPGEPAFALHAFHVPDAADLALETRRIDAFVLTATTTLR